MLTTDTGYLNTRDVIVQPNEPLSMSLALVDNFGDKISLDDTDIRWTLFSRGFGMNLSAVLSELNPVVSLNDPVRIVFISQQDGFINLISRGDVLNDPRGYDYVVETKPMGSEISDYKAVARGQIQVFNR